MSAQVELSNGINGDQKEETINETSAEVELSNGINGDEKEETINEMSAEVELSNGINSDQKEETIKETSAKVELSNGINSDQKEETINEIKEQEAYVVSNRSISAPTLQSKSQFHGRVRRRPLRTSQQSSMFYMFCVPPIMCALTIALPYSTGACGWLRYYESIWVLNISALVVHAIISLTLATEEDKELIENPSQSDRCLRRAHV
jgi:hypothetical protein